MHKEKYLLIIAFPLLFISIALRFIIAAKYFPMETGDFLVSHSDQIKDYELIFLSLIAFFCIGVIFFVYEKIMKQMDDENERTLLETQIAAQKNYLIESKEKYEGTKIFRHDFKNHMIALRGLLEKNEVEKARIYMDRFEKIYDEISFSVNTGNTVVDILLSEKWSHAQKLGIDISCDVIISKTVTIDDFDLCTIFANAIDNAIKGCQSLKRGEKKIDIAAAKNKNFFTMDIINPYEKARVKKGDGIGLSAIRLITQKYQGIVEINETDSVFQLTVVLPFEEKVVEI